MQGKSGKHGGRVRPLRDSDSDARRLLDFSANVNPLGPPAWLRGVLSRAVSDLIHYPDPDCVELRASWSAHYGLPPEMILPGNGASELITLLPAALDVQRVIIPAPAYVDYALAARAAGREVLVQPTRADFSVDLQALEAVIRPDDLIFLGHPSNPAGKLLDRPAVLQLAAGRSEGLFVIDEAFIDFVADAPDFLSGGELPANIVVLRSFTKFYAIPGLRLGALFAAAQIVRALADRQADWSVNALAQAVGLRAPRDREYAEATRGAVANYRAELARGLEGLSALKVFPGQANYLLSRREDGGSVAELCERMLARHDIAIRDCSNYDCLGAGYFRVAVRTPEENERLIAGLADELNAKAGVSPAQIKTRPVRRARPLMIQGTASNAGKSLLTAAFCRILFEDGLRVAPFKAQNMSLNSFVTADGGEIARAQVVQAGACRLDPDVRMSPVLLKPGSETGSQVIVGGRPVAHMKVREYQAYKPTAWQAVRESYDSLAAEFDAVVLEGAGSPGEVNLKQHDIVNMKMARYARAPVLLAGDIDRGGVFASFVGTMEVLEEWERELVAGFLVNRFRGDASLLDSALEFMIDRTGRPVLGVIPYLPGHGLPEEDSVNFKDSSAFFQPEQANGEAGETGRLAHKEQIEIALIDLPFISNFTDFEPLAREPDVHLRIVRRGDALGRPDLVLLPGTKNSPGDLAYLNRSGLALAIQELARNQASSIVGVCGGMQMLGRRLHDPDGIESSESVHAGLGLLDLETTLAGDKTLRQVKARHAPSGLTMRGYEIHHGRTVAPAASTIMDVEGEVAGVSDATGLVWGTYLHGLFDDDAFRRWFIDGLRTRRGLEGLGEIQTRYDLEPAFDRLAAHVRESVDLRKIYQLMGL